MTTRPLMTTRTVITLRARFAPPGDPPAVGELMASASGRTAWRIVGVVKLRVAGDPRGTRYRLTCLRLAPGEAPEGSTIHPWRWDRRAPPQEAVQAAPVPPPVVTPRKGRQPSQRPRQAEERTIADLGPSLRRRAVRDRRGCLLREADVEVDDQAADPRAPNRRLRRAYRVDPVDTLRREGAIGPREADAAEELRVHLERLMPSLGGGGGEPRISVSGFLVEPISDTHIRASKKLRQASIALGARFWDPVLWLCLGGTVKGFSEHHRVTGRDARDLVVDGMRRLADHFYGETA